MAIRIPRLLGDRLRKPREGKPLHRCLRRRLQQDPAPQIARRPDAGGKAQERRLNGRSAFAESGRRHGSRPAPEKIIYEKAPQGCCGTKRADPKTGADSGECGKRGQSMLRTPNQKTAPEGIVHRLSTLSALPTNATQTNAPKVPKHRPPQKNKPTKSYKPSPDADESDPEVSQKCRTRTQF